MAVAVALMLPDSPAVPGRTAPLDGLRLDNGLLTAVMMLGVLQLTVLTCAHARWVAPRLQGWDLRGLLCWLVLIANARLQAFMGWPMLPLRALVQTYALLLVCSAVPSLLLGGAARVESRSGAGWLGRWTHRLMGLLCGLRVVSAATLLIVGAGGAAPWAACLRYAYAADAGWALVALALALVLHLAPTGHRAGDDAPGHAVLTARRGARWLWMLAVFVITAHETAMMIVWPAERTLQISAVISVYAYFGLLVAGASCLDAKGDPLLVALPSKPGSILGKIYHVAKVWDALGVIPFDKPLFFDLRSALAEDHAAKPFVGSVPATAFSSIASLASKVGFAEPAPDVDSEGGSIYGAVSNAGQSLPPPPLSSGPYP